MGLFDGLLEIGGEEAVVAYDKGGVVAADEDVSRRINGFQFVVRKMLPVVAEMMIIEGAFVSGWICGGEHVCAVGSEDVAFAIDIIQTIDHKAEVAEVRRLGAEVDIFLSESVKKFLRNDI